RSKRDWSSDVCSSDLTVSRVLNYHSDLSVGQETKQKVFEVAEALNYTKHMQKKRTQAVLRLVQWYDSEEELEDLYYLAIRLGVRSEERRVGNVGGGRW